MFTADGVGGDDGDDDDGDDDDDDGTEEDGDAREIMGSLESTMSAILAMKTLMVSLWDSS